MFFYNVCKKKMVHLIQVIVKSHIFDPTRPEHYVKKEKSL
ncbi:hypothetical protein SAMN03080601_02932 [Alkalitalea saponilacus]|uniref:Uncharacterized protein n=1 Tax=Alkalitalea saponilacus TaxID=889453 RepID=A0A1T5HSZ8_9BACT|nr:hypothetical protein SAMN03080601_02932 [Alkalitalea saponilacus]